MEALGKIVINLLLLIIGILGSGLLVFQFYNWFILPVYNIPTITFYEAIGLGFFIALFKNNNINRKEESESESEIEQVIAKHIILWLAMLCILGIGWLFKTIFLGI